MMPSALTGTQLIKLHPVTKGFCGAHADRAAKSGIAIAYSVALACRT
jgi:hypothetical protein